MSEAPDASGSATGLPLFLGSERPAPETARRQLLANTVHELARPLGALKSAVQALRYGADADIAFREELLAGQMDVAGMAEHIGVDSLAFITLDGLYRAMGEPGRNSRSPQYCDACFTGEYPTRLTDRESKDAPAQLTMLAEMA